MASPVTQHGGRVGVLSTNVGSLLLMASAVDVVDVGGGKLPVVLTPFLILAAVAGGLALLRMPLRSRQSGHATPTLCEFVESHGFLFCFLVVATLSVVFTERDSLDVTLPRLFYLYLIAGFAVVFVTSARESIDVIILRGTTWYIVADAVYVVLQYASVLFDIKYLSDRAVVSVGDLLRPSGLTGDPNRAAVNLILMVAMRYAAARARTPNRGIGGWPSGLAVVLSLATLSRSGLLELAAVPITIALLSQASFVRKVTLSALTAAAGGLLVACAYLFLAGTPLAETATEAMVSDPHRQTSTTTHLALIWRSIDLATDGPKAFLIGEGWGTRIRVHEGSFSNHKDRKFPLHVLVNRCPVRRLRPSAVYGSSASARLDCVSLVGAHACNPAGRNFLPISWRTVLVGCGFTGNAKGAKGCVDTCIPVDVARGCAR